MQFIKNLKSIMTESVGVVIVTILILAGLVSAFDTQQGVIDFFIEYSPLFLFGIIAIYAQFKGYSIISLMILLMIFYPNSIANMFEMILQFLNGTNAFSVRTIIHFLIGLFILLMLISLTLNGYTIKPKLRNIDVLFLSVALIQVLMFNNMIAAMNSLFLAILALLLGSRKITAMLLITKYIVTPINYMVSIVEDKPMSFSYHFRTISEIIVLVVMIIYLLNLSSYRKID
ncbi:hypothetical protein N7603_02380 [Acholeplasma vituli]|uniref:Uncharacterized protein n=1 Tax=Paracholeplasma vituli TaxID=69473 RepID=A0ABT2PU83_9MOLU|nr:hypothetical protein [Paracholeplasma vituli]MCU0104501.1 hypothetical protein [Paracholeplasma vituli]